MVRIVLLAFVALALVGLGAVLVIRGGGLLLTLIELRERYAAADSEFVTIDGLSVHVRDQGPRDAPAIILIHGSFGSLTTWETLVERLRNRYRLIRLDLPGYGLSASQPTEPLPEDWVLTDLIAELMDARGIDRAVFVGTSSGGSVAYWTAARFPERVERLVLMNNPTSRVAIPRSGRPPDVQRAMWLAEDVLKVRTEAYWWTYYRYLWGEPARLTSSLIREYYDMNRRVPEDWPRQIIPANPAQDEIDRRLAAVTQPVLIVWGLRDPVLPPENLDALDAKLVQAPKTIVRLATVGHYPMSESGTEVAAIIDDWLQTGTATTPAGL